MVCAAECERPNIIGWKEHDCSVAQKLVVLGSVKGVCMTNQKLISCKQGLEGPKMS